MCGCVVVLLFIVYSASDVFYVLLFVCVSARGGVSGAACAGVDGGRRAGAVRGWRGEAGGGWERLGGRGRTGVAAGDWGGLGVPGRAWENGRAHVRTPVPTLHLVSRLLHEKKKKIDVKPYHTSIHQS